MTVAQLRAQRGDKFDALKACANALPATPDDAQIKAYRDLLGEVKDLDGQIERALEVQSLEAASAEPVAGQPPRKDLPKAEARVKGGDFPVGRLVKSLYQAQGNVMNAASFAEKTYGEGDPVVKALNTSVAESGGATLPEDFATQMIDLLRPKTVMRSSVDAVIEMPRGTMRMPKQTGGVTGSYGREGKPIKAQQPKVGNIVAVFKKLTVKVPISNDWLRYTSPGTDALVQKDIVSGLARTEDLAFLRGDGTADWPKGLKNIAIPVRNVFASAGATLAIVEAELTKLINALETQDVPMDKPVWLMNPRVKNFLASLQNEHGFYVYRDEMAKGLLKGYAFKTTTTIPANLGGGTETELMLVDASEAIIFDAMMLALTISQEAAYQDEAGNWQSAFDNDETLIRAIAEHDFHLRHDEAVALLTGVTWGA
jgi:HK97 family phage major capsid protein